MFYLRGCHDEKLRLKSFSSTSRSGKSTIKIELETNDPFELGYALQNLSEVEKGQKAKQAKPRRLALPPPDIGDV